MTLCPHILQAQLNSVQFSHSILSNSLRPQWLQHARLPCPSPTPRACSNSCPLSQWCHPTIWSWRPLLPAFTLSQHQGLFQWASFHQVEFKLQHQSVLPMNIRDWFPLGLIGLISLHSKGFSRVFSNTTVQKNQFFSAHLSWWSSCHIHKRQFEKP